jgi:hypothetical protein
VPCLLPLVLATSLATAAEETRPEPTPKLVVFLTIDQARGDYLERFVPSSKGGFERSWRGEWSSPRPISGTR